MTADRGLSSGYSIRQRRPDDDQALLDIEQRAAELFRAHGYPQIADSPVSSFSDFRDMLEWHQTWVAIAPGSEPAGYAMAGPLMNHFHLHELSVDPSHGRKGVGAALVRRVMAEGLAAGAVGVSLTTFRAVPFNAPFYARLGFAELPLDQAPDHLRAAFSRELGDVYPMERTLMVHRFSCDLVAEG